MTFFADESLDALMIELLREEGYTVFSATGEMKGSTDHQVLQRATKKNAILITKDKDFGELVIRNKLLSAGVVLIRINQLNILQNCLLVLRFINKYHSELAFSFAVIEEDKIRIRKL